MIKSTELRIGNLFYSMAGDTISALCKVETICQTYAEVQYWSLSPFAPKDNPGIAMCPYENGQLIPLTPEILEKCGWHDTAAGFFLRISSANASRILYYSAYGDNSIMKLMDDAGYVISMAEGIKYLHQLQNLYFALTGEELTVKL